MYYLYYILPDRRLVQVRDKNKVQLSSTNKDIAFEMARQPSKDLDYPVHVNKRGDLHNTRDDKPCDNEDFPNNPRLYLK